MTQVVDFSRIRAARDRPDPDLVYRDDLGRELRTYALEYEMGGKRWGFSIVAYSMEDAEARVAAMRASLVLCGEIHRVVPS